MLGPKPTAFDRKKIDPLLNQLKQQQQVLLQQKAAMEKQDKNRFRQQIQVASGKINLVGQQISAVQGMLSAVDQLKTSQISLRIYYETTDGFQILLASAGDAAPPKQPAKKN